MDSKPAPARGRRITLEIPEALYARLVITKVHARKSISALTVQALGDLIDRLSAERRAGRPETDAASETAPAHQPD